MSKHIFEQKVCDTTYHVQIGWDRPMKRFYFVISPYVNGEIDDPIASNLYLENPNAITLGDIANACIDHGLEVPDGLLRNVETDRATNAVNEERSY